MQVEAATFPGAFDEGRVAGEPQALLLDARVDIDTVLQGEALAHALPDILRRLFGRLDQQRGRFVLDPCLVVVRANAIGFVELTGALAAHQGGCQGQRTDLGQARQGDGMRGSAATGRHRLIQVSGRKSSAILETAPGLVNL